MFVVVASVVEVVAAVVMVVVVIVYFLSLLFLLLVRVDDMSLDPKLPSSKFSLSPHAGSMLGASFTSITAVLFFVAGGVGEDDAIVLVDAVDALPPSMPPAERMRTAFARSGVSITITTLSTAVAFMFSTTSIFPAMKSFSINAYLALLALLVFTLMVTMSVVAIGLRRRSQLEAGKAEARRRPTGRSWRSFVIKSCVPCLGHPLVSLLVLVVAAGVTAGAVIVIPNITVGQEFSTIVPSDSYVIPYRDAETRFFGGEILDISVVLPYPTLESTEVRAIVADAATALAKHELIMNESVVNFLPDLETYARATNKSLDTRAAVAAAIGDFTDDVSPAAHALVRFMPDGQHVMAFRLLSLGTPLPTGTAGIDQFLRLRSFVAELAANARRRLADKNESAAADEFDMYAMAATWRFRDANSNLVSQLTTNLLGGNALIVLLLVAFLPPDIAFLSWVLVVTTQVSVKQRERRVRAITRTHSFHFSGPHSRCALAVERHWSAAWRSARHCRVGGAAVEHWLCRRLRAARGARLRVRSRHAR